MTDVIREKCKSLRLAYVADLYEKIPFENPQQYLMDLLQQEIELREIAKGERLIKKAKFMNEKELEDYQWGDNIHFPANLDRDSLEFLSFTKSNENVILSGHRELESRIWRQHWAEKLVETDMRSVSTGSLI